MKFINRPWQPYLAFGPTAIILPLATLARGPDQISHEGDGDSTSRGGPLEPGMNPGPSPVALVPLMLRGLELSEAQQGQPFELTLAQRKQIRANEEKLDWQHPSEKRYGRQP